MAELKRIRSDMSAGRIAELLAASGLTTQELVEVAQKLVRSPSFSREIGKHLRSMGKARPKEAQGAEPASLPDHAAAKAAIARSAQERDLTNGELVHLLRHVAPRGKWKPDLKSGRDRIISTFLKVTGPTGIREALRMLGSTQQRDPFLDGLTAKNRGEE